MSSDAYAVLSPGLTASGQPPVPNCVMKRRATCAVLTLCAVATALSSAF